MNMPNTIHEIPKPEEKFRKAMRQILSVSKRELERREAEWKDKRKQHESHRRHR